MLRSQQAFTLIELLVVISIIGLLSSVVLSSLSSARESARDARRQRDINQIQTALEMYYNEHGQYPYGRNNATDPNGSWSNSADGSWDQLASDLEEYISPLPEDPLNSTVGWAQDDDTYNYSYFSNNYGCSRQWYMIVYRFEKAPAEHSSGVVACDGTSFNYGESVDDTSVRTVGQSNR